MLINDSLTNRTMLRIQLIFTYTLYLHAKEYSIARLPVFPPKVHNMLVSPLPIHDSFLKENFYSVCRKNKILALFKVVIDYFGIVFAFEVLHEFFLIPYLEFAMAVDTALLATLEGPNQFEILSKAIESNPEDFNSWTQLLTKLDEQVAF